MQSRPVLFLKCKAKIFLLALCAVLQAACGSNAVYTGESFATDSPFKMKFDSEVATACESARRSLLGQGYLIDVATVDTVKGRKALRNKDSLSTFIEMNVVCVPESKGSALFVNGVLSTYDLKKSSSSASVGVAAVGSISLPFGQSADSLVKISEETIDDKNFYSRFFAAVEHTIGEIRLPDPDPAPAPTEPASAPVETPLFAPGTEGATPAPRVPEGGPQAPAAEGVPLPAPDPGPVQGVPVSAPEPVPVQGVPVSAPEPVPVQGQPVLAPAAMPVQGATEPAAAEALPAPAAPVMAPEPVATQAAPSAIPEPATPMAAPEPGSIPAEESPATAPAHVPYFGM
ncbi:MAG: DUF2242 domain-containing protein [Gammaproteobacteria bacterium]|nr:DUF2242 domain-containing protein [Gammaproteobacteria bacterium]MBP6051103.1 DUF2242 domain-containing protein [Pseudomonadales bacterium]MBK7168541.1 DUF2242 domain-containing protein [Gammaproteobacteria bacterium]MBK7728121.1 DUF2242 domain-containing protein [Gammaproteobacteria bacterium]MBK8308835.1 DUF2242 domain-containing protein [Gammaproteobacteria bacterium]